uniref:Uncharacterized protein n=1 Tax=Tanacetum cinerariifolium TaxID=118510 RepID=A0A699JMM3_TANCI|nr:hypothetical protein [Tanacetum cinerariifolium]
MNGYRSKTHESFGKISAVESCIGLTTIHTHTRLSLTLSSPHSRARYGHEPGSARALGNCAPTIPFEATQLLSHIGCPIEPRSWDLQSTGLGFPS